MKKLYLTFLWHMHQPYYKDDEAGVYHLPWVFLHGIKDYLEMAKYYEIYNIKAVFNLVPSLIEQIIDLSENFEQDTLIKKISTPLSSLSDADKVFLKKALFWANEKNMISVSSRYRELYSIYGNRDSELLPTDNDLLDMQVQFLLAWTGTFIRDESTFVKGLIKKDRFFSEDEKVQLLDILKEKFRYILEYYRILRDKLKIEISTTPYYHPILPLLIDPTSFYEALPDISIPNNSKSLIEDAEWHVKEAKYLYRKIFLEDPRGFWPAEGSVSSKTTELLAHNGILWMASDEDILSRSLSLDLKNSHNRYQLYKKYLYTTGDKNIFIFFRDKELSDLIGFVYSGMDAEKAANDFIERLREIYLNCNFSPHVSIILDGENAWEFYPNNAKDFFEQLYTKITQSEWIETITYSEAIYQPEVVTQGIEKIASGSWIYGNFSTWMGHHEKNKAWELLYDTIENFESNKKELKDETIDEIRREIHIAEGSDWFWWYGDDHYTEQADTLDYLFRKHLINVYKKLGVSPKNELLQPIKKFHKKLQIKTPLSEIYSNFDGKLSSVFDYLGAGDVDIKYDLSSMHSDSNHLQRMRWGFIGDNYLLIILIGNFKALTISKEEVILKINIDNSVIRLSFSKGLLEGNSSLLELKDYRIDEAVELLFFINKNALNSTIYFSFELYRGDKIIDKAPVYNQIQLTLTPKNLNEWIV